MAFVGIWRVFRDWCRCGSGKPFAMYGVLALALLASTPASSYGQTHGFGRFGQALIAAERAYYDGDYNEAVRIAQGAVVLADQLYDPAGPEFWRVARALNVLGMGQITLGNHAEGRAAFERAQRTYERLPQRGHAESVNAAEFLGNLAQAYMHLGDPAAALNAATEASQRLEALGFSGQGAWVSVQLKIARAHEALGDTHAAVAALGPAFDHMDRRGIDPLARSEALAALSDLLTRQGRFQEAESFRREALEHLLQNGYAPGSDQVLISRLNLGVDLATAGRWDDAENIMLSVVEATNPSTPVGVRARAQAARVLLEVAKPHLAETMLKEALQRVEEGLTGLLIDLAEFRTTLAEIYAETGRFDQAISEFEAVLNDVTERLGHAHPRRAIALNNLGQRYGELGELTKAETLLREAVSIRVQSGIDKPSLAINLLNLSQVYRRQGRLDDARMAHVASLEAASVLAPTHPTRISLALEQSLLDMARDDSVSAESGLVRLLLRLENAPRSTTPSRAVARTFLGEIYVILGRPDEAVAMLSEALRERAIYFNAPYGDDGLPHHPSLINTLQPLAVAHAQAGDLDAALSAAVRAVTLASSTYGSDHPLTASASTTLAAVHLFRDEPIDAAGAAAASVDIVAARLGRGGRISRLSGSETRGDEVSLDRDTFRLAVDATARVNGLGLPAPLTQHFIDRAWVAAQYVRFSSASAALASETARNANAPETVRKLIAERLDRAGQRSVLEQRWQTAVEEGRGSAVGRWRREIERLDVRLSELDDQLNADAPLFRDLIAQTPVPVSELLEGPDALLKPNEALVVFVEGLSSWNAFVVTHAHGKQLFALPVDHPVEDRVAHLRCALDLTVSDEKATEGGCGPRGAGGVREFDVTVAHSLYADLIAPFSAQLDGVETLLVVADGPLRAIPMEILVSEPGPGALVTGATWLSDRFAVTLAPSVPALRALRAAPRVREPADPAFVIADPNLGEGSDTDSSADPGTYDVPDDPFELLGMGADGLGYDPAGLCALSSLAQTRRMGDAIMESLGADPSTHALYGDAAREPNVVSVTGTGPLGQARVVAFSTHGLTAAEARLAGVNEPALVLTPPWSCSQPASPSASTTVDDDGLLAASEIAAMDLSADWVILAACNTASALSESNDEPLSGLARAFFMAGAREVLVSHWPAEAGATELYMRSLFNAGVAQTDATRAERVRAAQKIVRTTPGYAHPAFWGAFSIVGGAL